MNTRVEYDGHGVSCSSETQIKEQTYSNDLKPGAKGAPWVSQCLSDPPNT